MIDEIKINIIKSLSSENFNQRINDINFTLGKYGDNSKVTFDFTECEYISPTGIVFLSMFRDTLIKQGNSTFARVPQTGLLAKFIKSSGLIDLSIAEDEFLSKFTVKLTRCNSIDECSSLQNQIMNQVINRLDINESTFAAIDYMLNEIWDNSGVHGYGCYEKESYPKPIYISAFSYKDRVEIAIGDCGHGIEQTLRDHNPQLAKLTPKEIMLKSIENKISGHPKGSPGFGLYCASEFLRKGKGSLNIYSSNYHLQISAKRTKIIKSKYKLGTLVSFTVFKNAQIPFREIIGRDVDDYIDTYIDGVFV